MTVVVVAEKPSVGRDLARVLGATHRGEGLLSGNGYVVTWAIGPLPPCQPKACCVPCAKNVTAKPKRKKIYA